MNDIAHELTRLGKEIEEAKKNLSQLEGRKEEIIKNLQKEFGIKTIEEVTKLIGKLKTEIEDLNEEITKDFDELKDKFQW